MSGMTRLLTSTAERLTCFIFRFVQGALFWAANESLKLANRMCLFWFGRALPSSASAL